MCLYIEKYRLGKKSVTLDTLPVETQIEKEDIKATVKKNFSALVVPFVFKKDYKKSKKEISVKWETVKNNSRQKLYEHIHQLAVEEEKDEATGTIGRIYKLSEEGYRLAGLPENIKSKFFNVKKNKQIHSFKICEISVYLFETNIGFLVFEIEYPKNINIESYIETNNLIKNIKPQRGVSCEIYMGELQPAIQTNLSEITDSVLKEFEVTSYFESEKNVPKHAIIFNSTVLDFGENIHSKKRECKEQLKQYLFELRRAFRSSYRPSPGEFNIENNDEILQTFDNSYWGGFVRRDR